MLLWERGVLPTATVFLTTERRQHRSLRLPLTRGCSVCPPWRKRFLSFFWSVKQEEPLISVRLLCCLQVLLHTHLWMNIRPEQWWTHDPATCLCLPISCRPSYGIIVRGRVRGVMWYIWHSPVKWSHGHLHLVSQEVLICTEYTQGHTRQLKAGINPPQVKCWDSTCFNVCSLMSLFKVSDWFFCLRLAAITVPGKVKFCLLPFCHGSHRLEVIWFDATRCRW